MKISFEILWRWMLLVSIATILLGLILTILPAKGVFTAYDDGMLAPFWADGPPQAAVSQYRFLMGMIGATIMGWAVMSVFIAVGPFRRRELWAWWAFAAGVFVWIPVEATVCVVWGVTAELWFLGSAVIGYGLPLVLSKPHFKKQDC